MIIKLFYHYLKIGAYKNILFSLINKKINGTKLVKCDNISYQYHRIPLKLIIVFSCWIKMDFIKQKKQNYVPKWKYFMISIF